jgi:hypothetical protein
MHVCTLHKELSQTTPSPVIGNGVVSEMLRFPGVLQLLWTSTHMNLGAYIKGLDNEI